MCLHVHKKINNSVSLLQNPLNALTKDILHTCKRSFPYMHRDSIKSCLHFPKTSKDGEKSSW